MKCSICEAGVIEGEEKEAFGWLRFELSDFDGRRWRRKGSVALCSLSCAREYLLAQLHAVGEVTKDLMELERELDAPPPPRLWRPGD